MSTKPAISIDRETTTEALSLEAVPAPRVPLETTVLAPRVPVDTFLLYLVIIQDTTNGDNHGETTTNNDFGKALKHKANVVLRI